MERTNGTNANNTHEKQLKELQKQNRELKRRIASALRYIEIATEWGKTTGCDEILDVIVGTLYGDIR